MLQPRNPLPLPLLSLLALLLLPRLLVASSTPNRTFTLTNSCAYTVHPAILTSPNSTGTLFSPSGFELTPHTSHNVTVSYTWSGRVWARTNCTFPANSTTGIACGTGDCGGALECTGTGTPPVTLAEFTLAGEYGLSFYDISLVDGFDVDLGIAPLNTTAAGAGAENTTSPKCVASSPSEDWSVTHWCPWDNLLWPPPSRNSRAFWYPTQGIARPALSPCRSACLRTGSERDCCTGSYDDPKKCPQSLYSKRAKKVCPDAYSYAYDDVKSTFTVPNAQNPGFEITFCPDGESTKIQETLAGISGAGSLRLQLPPPFIIAVVSVAATAWVLVL